MDKNRIRTFIAQNRDAINKLFEDDLDTIEYVLGIACESLSLSEFVSFINKIDDMQHGWFKENHLDDEILDIIDAILERTVSRTWDCNNFFEWISYKMDNFDWEHYTTDISTDLSENLKEMLEKDNTIVKTCGINYTILDSNNNECKTELVRDFVIIPKGVNANLLGNGSYQYRAIEDVFLTLMSTFQGVDKKYIRLNWIEWDV